MFTFEEANARFIYVPETGDLISRKHGIPVGSVTRNRRTFYRKVSILRRKVAVHQIAWLLHTGSWQKGEIDHLDGDGLNNRISNLRDGDRRLNQRNQRVHLKSTSGIHGVSWHSPTGQWQALIYIDGKRKNLGRFKRLKHAAAARMAAAAANGYRR